MWYVMWTWEGQEEKTSQRCREALPSDLYRDTFVPKYVRLKKYQGAWHKEKQVLFPGYFFIDTDQPEAVEETLEPLGRIMKPVLSGDQFMPLWPEEQEFLEGLMDDGHTVQLSEGNMINGEYNIYAGPLKEKSRYLCHVNRHRRLAEMEIKLLGQMRRVYVGLEVVRKDA